MKEAVKQYPAQDFHVPDSIEFHPIDKENGLLLAEDDSKAYYEVFAPGTAPTRMSGDKQLKARDFFRLDLEDTSKAN
ncbi:MAG: hypothetical protein OQK97_00470 [Deltaproteobacteria bacterium]|nr:hypothetical protein [Deltaproteobacteria bacterium]